MREKSCFLIKPDQERSDLIASQAVKLAENLGLTVSFAGSTTLSLREAAAFYKEHEKKPWFFNFLAYFTSGGVEAYFTEGENAIMKTVEVRNQIRSKYAIDQQRNAIHAPDYEAYAVETIRLVTEFF